MPITKCEFATRRTMLALKYCWAITIHKSQGLTLEKIKVHLGKKEFSTGQTFVAISRVRKMTGLKILDLTKQRMSSLMRSENSDNKDNKKQNGLKEVLKEIDRLRK